jgi:hypothetical protein
MLGPDSIEQQECNRKCKQAANQGHPDVKTKGHDKTVPRQVRGVSLPDVHDSPEMFRKSFFEYSLQRYVEGMQKRASAFMCVCVCVCVCVCMYICIYVCIHVCVCIYEYVCVNECVYECMYECVYVCVLMFVNVFI